ncbi:Atg14 domain-containing protein [Streptomyces scopuliridis]|uniref:Atg14 domain-containing protein n=1 Tax=Streptomyces scopuliridis TaxID=452529 RepID=A0ACD4ZTP3_9ACTN|nr:hypothetical protein [Streptomyces scopuliridis]WSC01600.1 Atg14 domain-containing protein [Streptomyces scopuliridis]WSC04861.1 Atg14 domain-containing protein [Streptomyces scopuliridis]
MTPALDERERIRVAMDRILGGTPQASSGALTVVALAQEADVPRNALTQRHLDLKNEFYARVKERGETPDVEVRLRKTIVQLKKTIGNKNEELDQLRADVPALVRTVNQLALENQQLRQELAQRTSNVVALQSQSVPRPGTRHPATRTPPTASE